MGNEEIQNADNYYISINMVGKEMEKFLYCLNTTNKINVSYRNKKGYQLYDFWDYYYFPDLKFSDQLETFFTKFKQMKGALDLNFRECLIIRVKNLNSPQISEVLEKINSINREHYMPLVLFLLDEYNNDKSVEMSEKIVVPDIDKYPKLDKRMIYTESFEIISKNYDFVSNKFHGEITEQVRKGVTKIRKLMCRFCSYHNELGDYFSVVNCQGIELKYNLIEKKYDYTSNFCCIGRFGKGKSTGVNCILGEKKAKESRSGTATTKKINYYQVRNCPIKIIDIPGFESRETVANAIQKFKEFGDNMNHQSGHLTAILYFVKATDERMFAELEYKMFKEIIRHENVPVYYILTHSTVNIDKNEIYDMLNTGIKGVLDQHKEESPVIANKIKNKMKANENNCIFVNFYPEDDEPIFGIDEFFGKIQSLCI